jgi:hypothetical protein
LLIIVVGLAVLGVVVIIVAPWQTVREEKPLPADVEARLLLGEPPESVAADADEDQTVPGPHPHAPPTAS